MTNPDRIRAAQAATDATDATDKMDECIHGYPTKFQATGDDAAINGSALGIYHFGVVKRRIPGSTWIGLALVFLFSLWLAFEVGALHGRDSTLRELSGPAEETQ